VRCESRLDEIKRASRKRPAGRKSGEWSGFGHGPAAQVGGGGGVCWGMGVGGGYALPLSIAAMAGSHSHHLFMMTKMRIDASSLNFLDSETELHSSN
jgi:hypothetical protein